MPERNDEYGRAALIARVEAALGSDAAVQAALALTVAVDPDREIEAWDATIALETSPDREASLRSLDDFTRERPDA